MIVSIVAVVIFLLGSGGLFLGIIAVVAASFVRVNLPSFDLLVLLFGSVVIWPGLILAGYNLWKRKKWAGQLAVAIKLFDCMLAIVRGNVFALTLDVIILASIGLAWKHFQ
ncbi:MAG: hypothetical protein JSV85_07905 [Candidatus Bathyarchaeota archaeon]|nr:MAG: hypothetical protein JSV85_07905 [Candidatus Bathyarchaeota archaeon]